MASRGRGSQKVWVRSQLSKVVSGTSADTASVTSLRDASLTTTASGALQLGLPNEFTVVRFLAWVQVTQTDTAAGLLVNPQPGIIGVRVAGKEEIEELAADAAFRAESGPFQDGQSDWLLWGPTYPANGIGVEGTAEALVGKEMFDIRSARRVDSLGEDIALFLQSAGNVQATTTFAMRASFAALCVIS